MVRLQVTDLAYSLEFYVGQLGFVLLYHDSGRARLGAAGGDGPLVELVQGPEPATPAASQALGLYHFAVLLPTRAALGRLLQHLHQQRLRPGTSDHGFSESVYLRDPNGLGIEFYVDRPREAWIIEQGEVALKRAPLDEGDLVRSGGDEPWEGFPPGTVMGHIHLRVGDLAVAEAVYHRALGFDLTQRTPSTLMLAAGGYHHHLALNAWIGPTSAPPEAHEAQLLEWELILPDVAALEHAAAGLRGLGHRSGRAAEGDAIFTDRWGNRLRLALAGGA